MKIWLGFLISVLFQATLNPFYILKCSFFTILFFLLYFCLPLFKAFKSVYNNKISSRIRLPAAIRDNTLTRIVSNLAMHSLLTQHCYSIYLFLHSWCRYCKDSSLVY